MRSRGRRATPPGPAVVVQRLAVLLAAGLPPLVAWRAVASGPGASPVAVRVASEASGAHRIAAVLAAGIAALPPADRPGWAALLAGWTVAERAGAPLAPSLDRLAAQLRALEQTSRDVTVALAGPLATARVVLALPPIGLAFGAAMGVDALALFATPLGWGCLGVGAGLLALGALWIRRLVRWARAADPAPGFALDLAALALGGGLPAPDARGLVAAALAGAGLPAPLDALDEVLSFAGRAGVPAGALLRAEADEARRSAASETRRRAESLAVRLMLPLGLCLLPAFVAVGVVPVVASLLGTVSSSVP